MKRHNFRPPFLMRDPPGYISFHSALRQLGINRAPEAWGATPEWRFTPFITRERILGFHKVVSGKYKWEPLDIPPHQRLSAREANARFWKIANELVNALRDHQAIPYVVTEGDRPAIIVKGSLRWHTQRERIVCDGYMRWAASDSAGVRRRIIVDAASFHRWLHPNRSQKDFLKADDALCAALTETLRRQAPDIRDFKYSLYGLWTMFSPLLKEAFTKADFKKRVLCGLDPSLVRTTRGSPNDATLKWFKDEKTQLQHNIMAAISEFKNRVSSNSEE